MSAQFSSVRKFKLRARLVNVLADSFGGCFVPFFDVFGVFSEISNGLRVAFLGKFARNPLFAQKNG